MRFSDVHYLQAAKEQIEFARILFERNDARCYVMLHYASGLAVECLLRAYMCRKNPEFEARHDLKELARRAGFDQLFPAEDYEEYAAYFDELYRRWQNNHRYCTGERLRVFFRKAGLQKGIRGDVLKESGRRIFNAASKLVELGVVKWNTSKTN